MTWEISGRLLKGKWENQQALDNESAETMDHHGHLVKHNLRYQQYTSAESKDCYVRNMPSKYQKKHQTNLSTSIW